MGEQYNLSTATMNLRFGHPQYLATYSQADESKFSTRESLGKMLLAEFNADNSVVKVDYWACSRVMAFTIITHTFYLSAYRHVCKSDQV